MTSANLQLKKTGFLVDYFIRPPITLTFHFEHEIWLSHISLETQVGQQKSKGIEILIQDSRIAKTVLTNPDQKEVTFQNFSFPGNRYRVENDQNKIRLHPESLKNIKQLKIKVFSTFQSSVPCLANLQIWGTLAPNSPLKAQLEVNQIWTALLKARNTPINQPFYNSNPQTSTSGVKRKEIDAKEVPAEFLDALTCKRMDVPMLLPCGQYVDRASLDRYIDNEAKWGRSANDPFTGVPFTDNRKAIFDAKLKSRIDAFVLGLKPEESTVKKPKIEESHFDFKGGNLDALLSQALQGKDRIFGSGAKNTKKQCKNCTDQVDLYNAKCCSNNNLLCKKCLLKLTTHSKCHQCNKQLMKKDFQRFHSDYE